MSFEEQHIDKIIKSKMDNLEIIPDDELWNNLEEVLLKNKNTVIRNRIVGTVILIVGIFIVWWFFYHTNTEEKIENKNIDSGEKVFIQEPESFVSIEPSTSVRSEKNQREDSFESKK